MMERKYLPSLLDCIGEVEMQPNNFLQKMKMELKVLIDIFDKFLQDEVVYDKILIAIDESKSTDYVIGFMIGEDIVDTLLEISETQEDPIIEQYTEIQRAALNLIPKEQIFRQNILVIDTYGVRKEYQALKIGQRIYIEYVINCHKIGYKIMTGLCYNKASVHITQKLGASINYFLSEQDLAAIIPNFADQFKEGITLPMVDFEAALEIIHSK